jgi:hypothetical protein
MIKKDLLVSHFTPRYEIGPLSPKHELVEESKKIIKIN